MVISLCNVRMCIMCYLYDMQVASGEHHLRTRTCCRLLGESDYSDKEEEEEEEIRKIDVDEVPACTLENANENANENDGGGGSEVTRSKKQPPSTTSTQDIEVQVKEGEKEGQVKEGEDKDGEEEKEHMGKGLAAKKPGRRLKKLDEVGRQKIFSRAIEAAIQIHVADKEHPDAGILGIPPRSPSPCTDCYMLACIRLHQGHSHF